MEQIAAANFLVAFFGGLISFFAPCVVVLIPAFLAHLAGVSLTDLEKNKKYRWAVFLNTIFFVLGFTAVFILLGASLGFLSQFTRGSTEWLNRLGGIIIIVLGIAALGLLDLPWLKKTHKVKIKRPSRLKYLGSFIVGAAFAIGWSPCVGPILATILLVASTSGGVFSGTYLLLAYSLGLTLPFLVTGFFTGWAAKFLSKGSKFLKIINYIAGALLIILGIFIFTGYFPRLISYLYFLRKPF